MLNNHQNFISEFSGHQDTYKEAAEFHSDDLNSIQAERDKPNYLGHEERDHEYNLLSAYLAEVNNHPRINRERELALGRRIKKGQELMVRLTMESVLQYEEIKQLQFEITRWLEKKKRPNYCENEIMSMIQETVTDLTRIHPANSTLADLTRRLNSISQKVREAKEEMINSNLRLVIKIAKNFMNRGFDLMDLIQEGNLGLMNATSKYDYTKGARFSTYASWWIRQGITKAIYDKGKTIRLPVHHIESRRTFFSIFYKLFKELEREPSPARMAEAMDISLDQVFLIYQHLATPVSLESTLVDGETLLRDHIVGDEGNIPMENISLNQLKEIVQESVESLGPLQAKIMKNRYEMDNEQRLSLNDLGSELDLSGERVRQIEFEALNRLRHPVKSRVLEQLI